MASVMEKERGLRFDQRYVIKWLLIVTGVLAMMHLVVLTEIGEWSWQLLRLFHLNKESNIPTWFTSMIWVLAGVAAVACSQQTLRDKDRRIWGVLAAALFFLSCDEVAMIHENVARIF